MQHLASPQAYRHDPGCFSEQAISPTEACQLIRATGAALLPLLSQASRIRDWRTGRTMTYSRKVFIPLTNLCRDRCAYCTFARQPDDSLAHTMTPEEVLAVAKAGKRAGCKEALFSLGDKPELRYPAYRKWLEARGYRSTIDYLQAMCRLVFEETGLLPHANPGTLTKDEIALLGPVTVSIGLMLESASERLLRPGEAHHACPDKHPAVRLDTLAAAGQLNVPATTGLLIGIGETPEERVDALFAIRELHQRYGHIQEVIVQNFRAKADTPFADRPEPTALDLMRTAAVARLILGDEINLQIPPNLTPEAYGLFPLAGINDWGGISPITRDYINPEKSWPALRRLKQVTQEAGFELRERLAVYPEFLRDAERFVPPGMQGRVRSLTDPAGLVKREEELW